MQRKENQTIIIWKRPRANQSHGDIIDYDVSWTKPGAASDTNKATVSHRHHSVALSLNSSEEHIVTVTARNINGSSSPSTITISPDKAALNNSWITGSNGTFSLSWPASPAASCGYIVDWCPTFSEDHVEWLRAAPNETNVTVKSDSFKDGIRYSLSIYACTRGSPVLLQRREGYVQEKRIEDDLFKPLNFKQHQLDVEIFWDSFSLRKQSAFIQGYVLYYQELNGHIFRVKSDDPHSTSITAKNLRITWYSFTVTAVTSVGECGNTSITAKLNSQTEDLFMHILVALLGLSGFISLSTIFCYKHWSSIKHKVYPPIPKPVLSEKWLISLGQPRGHSLHLDHSLCSEADIQDPPELLLHYGTLVTTDVNQRDKLAMTQTSLENYNTHHQKYISHQPRLLPTAVTSAASHSPGLTNPSYNLTVQTETLTTCPGLQHQEDTTGKEMWGGEQPQSVAMTFSGRQKVEDLGGPMCCDHSYISLPSASSHRNQQW
uniref:Fibronectin type-III domain-containing protein n=2 Tax=Gouania willdenowi TaxID=441366 RepID=A0A8C5HIT0_GOUWI